MQIAQQFFASGDGTDLVSAVIQKHDVSFASGD